MSIVIVNNSYCIHPNFLAKIAFFVGNSVLRHLNGFALPTLKNRRFTVKSKFHTIAKIHCLNDHLGTNDLSYDVNIRI